MYTSQDVLGGFYLFFFFNDTATTEIYTLSLHDALPISIQRPFRRWRDANAVLRRERLASFVSVRERRGGRVQGLDRSGGGSEKHTSELQSRPYLGCRPFLEKKKYKH